MKKNLAILYLKLCKYLHYELPHLELLPIHLTNSILLLDLLTDLNYADKGTFSHLGPSSRFLLHAHKKLCARLADTELNLT